MQDINILQIILNYMVPLILGGIIGFLSTKIKNYNKKDKAIEDGLVALLRNELVRRYREYETKGEMAILDKENIEDMFKQYENLGGNGTVKKMYKELLDLPTKIVNQEGKNMKNWLRCAGIRAIKTVAQTAVSLVGVGTVMSDVDWMMIGSASLLAGILSLLTSVAGLPEMEEK